MRLLALLAAAVAVAGCATPPPAGPAEPDGPVVALGDSYTSGTGAPRDEAYPAVLGRALGRPVVGVGSHGHTAEDGLARFERDVAPLRPSVVVVEFGVNEAFRGQDAADALVPLTRIVHAAHGVGADVVLVDAVSPAVGEAGTRGGPERFDVFAAKFRAGLRDLAERNGTGLVLGALDGVLEDPALRSDAYHPNAAGYALMATRIEPEVERVLAEREARRGR